MQHLANLLWAFATLDLHPGRRMMDAVVEVLFAVEKNYVARMMRSANTGLALLSNHGPLELMLPTQT